MSVEEKLAEMGLRLPPAPAPVASYLPAVEAGDLLFTSGQLPFEGGSLRYRGRVGHELGIDEGYQAARLCALNCLAVIKSHLGDLGRVRRIVRLTGYVNSTPDFTDQPKVLNGASDLLASLFGEGGRHARIAVGVAALPLGAAVELEMVVQFNGA